MGSLGGFCGSILHLPIRHYTWVQTRSNLGVVVSRSVSDAMSASLAAAILVSLLRSGHRILSRHRSTPNLPKMMGDRDKNIYGSTVGVSDGNFAPACLGVSL
jgi:hypothetical protein